MDGWIKENVSAFKESTSLLHFGRHKIKDYKELKNYFTRSVVRIYLWKRIQQGKLCSAEVDRKGADIKPASQKRESSLQKKKRKTQGRADTSVFKAPYGRGAKQKKS